ncbi:hypothetical protein [Rhodovastum atsumiense]|uniref:hypothetical protein n=1 Tax=Rhodovastum atsumiense TaxID=504468 RepID=UPI002024F340|nr:hypothetical protein [Rhodovastum atsumiense]
MLSQGLEKLDAYRSSLGSVLAFTQEIPARVIRGRRPIEVRLLDAASGDGTCILDVGVMRVNQGSLIVTAEEPGHAVHALWRGGETAGARACPAGAMLRIEPRAFSDLTAIVRGLVSETDILIPVVGT